MSKAVEPISVRSLRAEKQALSNLMKPNKTIDLSSTHQTTRIWNSDAIK